MTLALATHPAARLAPDDFIAFCAGLRLLARVDLAQYKRDAMERRVRTFADRRGHGDLGTYLGELRHNPLELELFLARVTPNASRLWRDPEAWRHLTEAILPALAAETGQLRIWSAGCSYGAEAYTLAACARAAAPTARLEVCGTDIDPRLVDRANLGRFSAADACDAPEDQLRRWFASEEDGSWRVKAALRATTRFEVGDLLRLRPRPDAYDLVVCRHTASSFEDGVRAALFARLAASVRPGGCLVVGLGERIDAADALGLVEVAPSTYRRA